MRILILIDCYLPSEKSGPKLVHDLGKRFLDQGHEVTLLTASPAIAGSLDIHIEDGIRVVRVKAGNTKGVSKVIRAIREVRLGTTIWNRAEAFLSQNPCDLVIFYSPTIFFSGLVRRLKARWNCPAYLILRDIFPQWAVDAGILRKGLIWRFFRRKEVEQYDAADIIAVQSPANLEYFGREFPLRSYHLEVLYNWMTLREPDLPPTNYRAQLGLQEKVVFFYGGNLGLAQDVDNILRLAASLGDHPHVYFLLVGEGSEVPRLKRSIGDRGLRNIQVLPAVGQKEYFSMVSEFDVGLISLDRRLTTQNVPGKLLGYLYWGIPVLASINPGNDLFEIIQGREAGYCLLNGEDQSLTAAALRLANDPELRARMGRESRQLLERTFSVEAAAHQIIAHLARREPAKFALPDDNLVPVSGPTAGSWSSDPDGVVRMDR